MRGTQASKETLCLTNLAKQLHFRFIYGQDIVNAAVHLCNQSDWLRPASSCIQELCPNLFSMDHQNYVCLFRVILNLHHSYPYSETLLCKKGFRVSRSPVPASRNAADLTIEQTVNRYARWDNIRLQSWRDESTPQTYSRANIFTCKSRYKISSLMPSCYTFESVSEIELLSPDLDVFTLLLIQGEQIPQNILYDTRVEDKRWIVDILMLTQRHELFQLIYAFFQQMHGHRTEKEISWSFQRVVNMQCERKSSRRNGKLYVLLLWEAHTYILMLIN